MAEFMGWECVAEAPHMWETQLGARVSIPNNLLLLRRPQSPRLHRLQRHRGLGAPCSHTCSCSGGEAETGVGGRHLVG